MYLGLISTATEVSELAQTLKSETIIGFDTEFIRESTFYPSVEIIQVATETDSWLVDAQAFKKNVRAGGNQAYDPGILPLLEVFEDPNILKIVHASQGDQECLYTSFGIIATPTLDTAVAASLCGYGDGIGLGKLLQSVLDVHLAKGHARTNWSVRPLPAQLVEYAHLDVKHLVLLGKTLIEQLDKMGRKNWALELSAKWENKELFEPDAIKIAEKLARGRRLDKQTYATLVRLVQWRESRTRLLNLPRRWIADDHVLLDLAQVRPKDMAHLSSFRGLNKGEVKSHSEAIFEAFKVTEGDHEISVPKTSKLAVPTPAESQVLDLLRCYVGILADEHQIAAKHLMSAQQLLPLLRNKVETKEELRSYKLLNDEALELIGDDLIAMVRGKRAIWIKKNKIETLELPLARTSVQEDPV